MACRFENGNDGDGVALFEDRDREYDSLTDLFMRQILETEQYVPVPPMLLTDPFYRITYLFKEEIRKYKWIEGEQGRKLSWEEARKEWMEKHRAKYEEFLLDTMTM